MRVFGLRFVRIALSLTDAVCCASVAKLRDENAVSQSTRLDTSHETVVGFTLLKQI